MNTLKRVLSWTPILFAFILAIPTVSAGLLGDAFEQTISSSGFSYRADASITFGKGGESDLPFNLSITSNERGGKNSGNFGKKGHFKVILENIDDLPPMFSDLSFLSMAMEYSGAQVGDTNYAEIPAVWFDTDSKTMGDITGMMNQLSKFFTGRTFRISQSQLADRMRSLLGPSTYGPSEEELLLSFLSGGSQSVEQTIGAFGNFLDDLVSSGLLILQEGGSAGRIGRAGLSGEKTYSLTFANQITVEGARIFRDGLVNFLSAMLPGIGEVVAVEIGRESAEVIASDLNDFLYEIAGVDFTLEVTLTSGRVSGLYLLFDTSRMNVPLRLEESVSFNYFDSYRASIPTNERQIIDLNEIINGFVTIAEIGGSVFQPSYNYYDYGYEDPVYTRPYVLSSDSLVYEDVLYIESICFGDITCERLEMRAVQLSLSRMVEDGFISSEDYMRAISELRDALR